MEREVRHWGHGDVIGREEDSDEVIALLEEDRQ